MIQTKSLEAIFGEAPEGAGGAAAPASKAPRATRVPPQSPCVQRRSLCVHLLTTGEDDALLVFDKNKNLPAKATFNVAVHAAFKGAELWGSFLWENSPKVINVN